MSKTTSAHKSKITSVTICPKCNSTDVNNDYSNPALVKTGLHTGAKVCNHCGHCSNFFPDVETDNLPEVKHPDDVGKRNFVNTSYVGDVNKSWRIVGSFSLVSSLIMIQFYNVKAVFFGGLLILLPVSIAMTVAGFRRDLLDKYKFVRILIIMVFIYTFTLAPYLYSLMEKIYS